MPTDVEAPARAQRWGFIRGPQNFVAGVALVALALFAIWAVSDLPQGTLRAMGPAMLPRWLAIGVGLCGLALVVTAFLKQGDALERWSLRGPLMVMIAVLAFAVTIRPFSFGGFTTPGLGLVFAGPLAILIGGYGTQEARLRELVILALTLTPVCMVLFGDALGLAIPMFPQSVAELFPADWSQKLVLRTIAAIMVLAAAVILLTWRRPQEPEVPGASGRI
jgi:hypothetical protein